jgi:hypothetical protein
MSDIASDITLPATPFLTVDGLPLHLANLYRGASGISETSAFIILSGPSVLDLNLTKLSRRGVFTIGVNNSPSLCRVNAWTCVDRPRKFHDGIWWDPGTLKIVPVDHLNKTLHRKEGGRFHALTSRRGSKERITPSPPLTVRDLPGVIGYQRNDYFNPATWLLEPSVNWGNSRKASKRNGFPCCWNVMFAVLKIAYALGFRRIFLLGCDFRMGLDKPYAFEQEANKTGVDTNNRCYFHMNTMLSALKPYFDSAGYRVFNCCKTSGLEVFSHLSFEDAIADATCEMPNEPWDVAGWYQS